MTLRLPPDPVPGPDADETSASDRRQHQVTSLAYHTVSTWANTARLITIAAVLLGLIIAGVWLLKIDVQVGPVQITGR